MGRKRVYEIIRHLTEEEIDKKIKEERNVKVVKRLYFIKYLYMGMSVEEAARLVGVAKATGYSWLKRWNKEGYEGLIPKFGGGRPPKLTNEQKEELKKMLMEKDYWTTKEVQKLIEEKFGVKYSLWQVKRILKSLGIRYTKSHRKDYKKLKNAEEI